VVLVGIVIVRFFVVPRRELGGFGNGRGGFIFHSDGGRSGVFFGLHHFKERVIY